MFLWLDLSLYSAAVTRDIGMIKMSGVVAVTHNSNLSKNIFITPPAIISLPGPRWASLLIRQPFPRRARLGLMPLNGLSSKYPPTQTRGPGSNAASNDPSQYFYGGAYFDRGFPNKYLLQRKASKWIINERNFLREMLSLLKEFQTQNDSKKLTKTKKPGKIINPLSEL